MVLSLGTWPWLFAVNVPIGLTALLSAIYPHHRLGRGLGLNALIVGISFAVGPTVASIVLSLGTWPWLFAVNVPIGLTAL
ncbi:MFS transporter, partial [Caballeronia sp. M23-90]